MNTTHPLAPAYAMALPGHHVVLLFGLRWAPLVGSRPAALARRRAIAARATHYIQLGRLGGCFGMARLAFRWRQASHRHHAAAALFAACQEGAPVAWLARLPDGRYWLVAARDGAVLSRSDRIYADLERGRQAVQALCSEFPGLREVNDEQALASLVAGACPASGAAADQDAGIGASAPIAVNAVPLATSLIDALSAKAQSGDAMIALGWYVRARPGWWACSLPVVAGIIWRTLAPSTPSPGLGLVTAPSVPLQDVRTRWRGAQAQAMSVHWHGAASFVPVLTRLRAVPLSLAGWQLSVVQCKWARPAWNCRADFDRFDPHATNADFLHARPDAWTVRFVPMGRAHAHWTVPAASWDGHGKVLPDVDWVDAVLVSTLQRRAPAFTHITIGAPDVLAIDSVLLDEAGERLSIPVGLTQPRRRSIEVQGPLRSFGLIREVEPHVAWHTLRLTFAPRVDVGLRRSALHLELGGWVHEEISV